MKSMFRKSLRRAGAGFSLIELIVAVAIIAILTGIGIPSYLQYVQKSRRSDAKHALLDLAAREERYYTVNNTYTNVGSNLGYGTGNGALSMTIGTTTQDYTLSITNFTTTSYQLQAIPLPVQEGDTCGTYQLDNLGNQFNSYSGAPFKPISGCW